MPDKPTPRPDSGSRAGVAALIGAAVLVVVPVTASQEGFVPKVRPDPAHIPTVCYGETENIDPVRIYTKSECMELLRRRLASDYAPKVLQCNPELNDPRRKYVFAALIDASYNTGPGDPRKPKTGGVCNSRMAAKIHAGDWVGACNAFVGWYTTARDRKTGVRKQLGGLVTRRRDVEAPLCMHGAVLAPVVVSPPTAPPAAVPVPSRPATAPSFLQRVAAFFRHLIGG